MISGLTWEICARSNQGVLAGLDDRRAGARVIVTRNATRTAEVPLALDDPALEAAAVGERLLRCTVPGWRDPLFCGRITQLQHSYSADQEGVVVSAADPMMQLEKTRVFVTGIGFSPAAEGYKEFIDVQQAQIIWQLVNLMSANGIGVVQGATPNSVTRTLTFPAGTTAADGIRSVAGLDNGPEFEFAPVFGGDGRIARLDIFWPRQGADRRQEVKLVLGVDPDLDNTLEFTYTPTVSGIVNRYVAIGDQAGTVSKGGLLYPRHPAYRAEHAASIAQFGAWGASDSISGLTDPNLLSAAARGVVSANAYPIDSFTAALDPEEGPDLEPGKLWIGDTIAATIGLPGGPVDLAGRIAQASFSEASNGVAYVDLTCEPDGVSGVTGASLNVVMDSSEGTVPPPPPEVPPVEDPCAPAPPAEPDPCASKKEEKAAAKKKKKKKKK